MEIGVMKLCGCSIEHENLMPDEYGEEVLCSGWNPQLAIAGEGPVAQVDRHVSLLNVLTTGDVDALCN